MTNKNKKPEKMWGGRFFEATDPRVDQFTESLSEDYRLFRHDIAGSIAHANALLRRGILTAIETKKIIVGLKAVEKELEAGDVVFQPSDEDIHMYIERRLTEKIGHLGGKLHTGRSRNDQVALDIKLYLREKITEILNQTVLLQKGLVAQAEKQIAIYLPGYTHLQRAQPILLSHYLLCYYEMLERDRTRFSDCQKRLNQMPLGSGALAGNSFMLDRAKVAAELGFSEITANSIDAVSDRDFIAEFLSASSILMIHLSRWAEEWIIWASSEFGFIALSDRFCTGSSIMPQKKNPDVLELVRGKSGRVFGALINILTVLKGLPLSYNRDLQEDKRPLFDTVETVLESLTLMTLLLSEVQFNQTKMESAANDALLLATELADYLAQKGLPFREAHHIVGKIVQQAIATQKPFDQWSLTKFQKHSPIFQKDLFNVLTPRASIAKKTTEGGTATTSVLSAIKKIKKKW
jgi:argininosuccinate lyase